MTDHSITPPPELVQEWWEQADQYQDDPRTYFDYVATEAAQWGADQELEACLRLVEIDAGEDAYDFARYIRAARRPEPKQPSLKEQALLALSHLVKGADESMDTTEAAEYVRRALEALPE